MKTLISLGLNLCQALPSKLVTNNEVLLMVCLVYIDRTVYVAELLARACSSNSKFHVIAITVLSILSYHGLCKMTIFTSSKLLISGEWF